MSFLQNLTSNHEIVLVQEESVAVLSLTNLSEKNIIGQFEFEYQGRSNSEAYSAAITDGYFDYINFIEDDAHEFVSTVRESLTNHYTSVYSESGYSVYQRNET